MKKAAPWRDKYFLRDLHQEINFYDRKLAYLEKFAEFPSPGEREAAEKGVRAKRATLEKAALELAASGIEYEEKDLPQSLRALRVEHQAPRRKIALVKRTDAIQDNCDPKKV